MGLFDSLFKNKNVKAEPNVCFEVKCDKPVIDANYKMDLAKAVFLNAFSNKPNEVFESDDNYARHFVYQCGIEHPRNFHIQMINDGYFSECHSVGDKLNRLSIAEVRSFIKSFGLDKKSKTKDVLVQHIVENVNPDIINQYLPTMYSITDKGLTFIQEHDDYIKLDTHSNWCITWDEYNETRKNLPKSKGFSFNDVAWSIFNKRIIDGISRVDDHSYRNWNRSTHYNMYDMLYKEKKYEYALEELLTVLLIDISGWYEMNSSYYDDKEIDFSNMMCDGIVTKIEELRDYFDTSLIDNAFEQAPPKNICDKPFFTALVHSICNYSYKENQQYFHNTYNTMAKKYMKNQYV